MKLIIDIPDEVLESKHYCRYFGAWSTKLTELIEQSTPYNPSGDLISRSALKETINSSIAEATEAGMVVNADYLWELLNYAIDNAPTVEMNALPKIHYDRGFNAGYDSGKNARPQGKWGKWVITEVQCPECLDWFNTDCYSMEELNKCPSCGATMKGGAE